MFSLRRKSKTQRLEISWPVESNREPLPAEAPPPTLPRPQTSSSSTHSAQSPVWSLSSFSSPEHDDYVSHSALPPRKSSLSTYSSPEHVDYISHSVQPPRKSSLSSYYSAEHDDYISHSVQPSRKSSLSTYLSPEHDNYISHLAQPPRKSSLSSYSSAEHDDYISHSVQPPRKSSLSSYYSTEHEDYVSYSAPPPRKSSLSSSTGPLPPPPPPPIPSSPRSSNHSPSFSQSSYPSDTSSHTAVTSYRPSIDTLSQSCCDDQSCHRAGEADMEKMFEEFREQIDISDKLPNAKAMAEAGDILIYDSEGNSRPFKSIYSGDLAIGEQQMVLFVRHFFCGACQAYIKALCKSITLQTYFTLPVPTSITIIGLGSPELINSYRRATGTQFAIYADPTRKLYKALGMSWTLRTGPRCDYMKGINEVQWIHGQIQQVRHEEKKLRTKGGNLLWVGGEFMFKDGAPVWCHRMKNFRGHSEIGVIRRILGVDDRYHAF